MTVYERKCMTCDHTFDEHLHFDVIEEGKKPDSDCGKCIEEHNKLPCKYFKPDYGYDAKMEIMSLRNVIDENLKTVFAEFAKQKEKLEKIMVINKSNQNTLNELIKNNRYQPNNQT